MTQSMCGGLFNGDNRFSAGGEFATNKITGTYTEGATIDVTVRKQLTPQDMTSRKINSAPVRVKGVPRVLITAYADVMPCKASHPEQKGSHVMLPLLLTATAIKRKRFVHADTNLEQSLG